MPLLEAPFFSSGDNPGLSLPDPVADASPDAWGRGLVSAAMDRRPSELDFLIMSDDTTRQGALRFFDEGGTPLSEKSPPIPRLNQLSELRRLAHNWETNPCQEKAVIEELQGYAGSLGGVRPKSNFDDKGVLSIAKFTSEQDTMPVERYE